MKCHLLDDATSLLPGPCGSNNSCLQAVPVIVCEQGLTILFYAVVVCFYSSLRSRRSV